MTQNNNFNLTVLLFSNIVVFGFTTMVSYSMEEKRDLLEIYLLNGENCNAALREYRRKYPNRQIPYRNIFKRIKRCYDVNGSVQHKKMNRVKRVLTEDMEIDILGYFEANPNKSIRSLIPEIGTSYSSIQRTLKKHKYRPFKNRKVQALKPNDFLRRSRFCHNILQKYEENNDYIKNILWTDESSFSTAGLPNRKNSHYWSTENPRGILENNNQGRESFSVWCGILNNKVIGPIFYNGYLTAARYLNFLRNEISEFLEQLPLQDYINIVWQQDGAPPHFSRDIGDYLEDQFHERIMTHGTILWPARSPDLTPMDFFFWSYLKGKVYETPCEDINEIQRRIRITIEELNQNPEILSRVNNHIIRRYNMCIEKNGRHVENYI